MLKEMLIDYYLTKKIKNSFRLIITNLVPVLFVLCVFAVFYYNLFNIAKGIEYLQKNPEYTIISYFATFIAHCALLLTFSKFYHEQDFYYFTQVPVKTSIILKYMVTKTIISFLWLPIIYGIIFIPFSWYMTQSIISTILFSFQILLLYICIYYIIYFVRSSLSISNYRFLISGIVSLVLLLLVCFFTAFFTQFLIFYNILLTIFAILLFRLADLYLIQNEKKLLISLDNGYTYKKRRILPLVNILNKLTISKNGIIFFEFFKSEIFAVKNIVAIIAAVLFSAFCVLFVINYPLDKETQLNADRIIMVIFIFIQLILSGILESRVNTQNWFFYKSAPLSFMGKFFLDYTPYIFFAFILSLPSLVFIFFINWQLSLLLLFDVILIPFLMWQLSFKFLGRRALGMIIFGIILLVYISIKILSPYLLVFLFLVVMFYLINSNKKRYLNLEI